MVAIPEDHGARRTFNEVLYQELNILRPGNIFPSPQASNAKDEERSANLSQYFQIIGKFADRTGETQAIEPLTAICLSGGGIRSATFNLGVLQRIAKIGLLGKVDYLSSVSGGGYVAGWLRAWMRRAGVDSVVTQLANACTNTTRDPLKPEPAPIAALREYSNYLTPQLGLFSGDTWAAAAIILRNLILNWCILLPLVAAALAAPLIFLLFVRGQPICARTTSFMLGTALFVELCASYLIYSSRRFLKEPGTPQAAFVFRCVAPVWVAASALSVAGLGLPALWAPYKFSSINAHTAPLWIFATLWCIAVPLVGWALTEVKVAWILAQSTHAATDAGGQKASDTLFQDLRQAKRSYEFAALVLSGAVAAAILVGCVEAMYPPLYIHPALYVILVNPVLLGVYLISRVLFVAIASLGENARPSKAWTPSDDDADREWWARLSGWILLLAIGWLGVTTLCLLATYLPDFIAQMFRDVRSEGGMRIVATVKWVVGALGAASGAIAALVGTSVKSPVQNNTQEPAPPKYIKVILGIAGPLFIVCVLVVLTWASKFLGDMFWGSPTLFSFEQDWDRAGPFTQPHIWLNFTAVPIVLASLSFLAGWIVNVNRFSLHGMYRNRLVRAYLGASNVLGNADEGRRPDPFTGFARSDNLGLSDLWPHDTQRLKSQAPKASLLDRAMKSALQSSQKLFQKKGTRSSASTEDVAPVLPKDHPQIVARAAQRPLPIFNTTLNLVHGQNLAWQERKAESFAMTPFFCGNVYEGYRASDKYGGKTGITVGNAMTISGAAANPNMGYSSSPVLSFIMTLFNVRLGVWLGNTNSNGDDTYNLSGPSQAIKPLFAELFGITSSARRYVNLSDGGHFDNLGIYEVVLRRCRRILVSDADADASFEFENLGNAIRKIRIDFGINITFKAKILILPRESSAEGALYCAIANIGYKEADGTEDGTLIYIKPTIHGRGTPVPYDVFSYALANKAFPHESTIEQWFSESQFESYRALGYHILEQLGPDLKDCDFRDFEEAVVRYLESRET